MIKSILPNYLIWTLAAKSGQEESGQNYQKSFHRSFFSHSIGEKFEKYLRSILEIFEKYFKNIWEVFEKYPNYQNGSIAQDLFPLTPFSFEPSKPLTGRNQTQLIQMKSVCYSVEISCMFYLSVYLSYLEAPQSLECTKAVSQTDICYHTCSTSLILGSRPHYVKLDRSLSTSGSLILQKFVKYDF